MMDEFTQTTNATPQPQAQCESHAVAGAPAVQQVVSLQPQSFGELLQEMRAEKGMSLDDLSESSKLRPNVLQAFETGTYDQLGMKGFYLERHVKRLSQALGDTEGVLLASFEADMQARGIEIYEDSDGSNLPASTGQANFSPAELGTFHRGREASKLPAFMITLICFLLLALIVAAVIYQKYSASKAGREVDEKDFDLPQLLQMDGGKMESLEIPTN